MRIISSCSIVVPLFTRLIMGLFLLSAGAVHASLLNDVTVKPVYMQTTEDADISAKIGDRVITVGRVDAGQIIAVLPMAADYYEFRFGFGTGFIDRQHLTAVKGKQRVEDRLGDLNRPLSNQNLVTWQDTRVYSAPNVGSVPFGMLADNLRYPLIGKLKDRLNQTWFQIRIGDRLAYVSSVDAQEDSGIPVLTWHHILKDEENSRFRHTSTTTSLRAFTNQMAWLNDMGYTTLTLYQLEGYLRNRLNLPARAVVITFDDGLKSVSRYAYPVLKQYGFHATAFVISSRIKRHPQRWAPKTLQFMSISELKSIQDVFDVQSHTHFLHRTDRPHHPVLLSRSYHNILFDFERSRRALSQFNPYVLYLSYPFGGYDAKAVKAAGSAGFHLAVTTVRGKVKPGDNPFLLKRLYILREDSLATMARLISNLPQDAVMQ